MDVVGHPGRDLRAVTRLCRVHSPCQSPSRASTGMSSRVHPGHLLGREHVLDPVRRDVLRRRRTRAAAGRRGSARRSDRRSDRSGPRRETPRRSTPAGRAAPRPSALRLEGTPLTQVADRDRRCPRRTRRSARGGRRTRPAAASSPGAAQVQSRRWPAVSCRSTAAHRAQSAGSDASPGRRLWPRASWWCAPSRDRRLPPDQLAEHRVDERDPARRVHAVDAVTGGAEHPLDVLALDVGQPPGGQAGQAGQDDEAAVDHRPRDRMVARGVVAEHRRRGPHAEDAVVDHDVRPGRPRTAATPGRA